MVDIQNFIFCCYGRKFLSDIIRKIRNNNYRNCYSAKSHVKKYVTAEWAQNYLIIIVVASTFNVKTTFL